MTAQSRAIDRIMRICATAAMDDRSLRVAILNEIRPVVAFDAFVWLLTDPQTEVGCSPLADVPCLPELPRLIMLKYLTPFNRWTRLKGPVARMHESSGGRLERSLVWSSLLSRYGVTDVASVVFRGRQGCWGFLDLWRINPSAPFTESEAGFLTSIAKGVTEALQGSQAGTFKLASPSIPGAGPAVLILSPELEVRAQTAETNEYLRLLIPLAYAASRAARSPGACRYPGHSRHHRKELTNGAIGSLLESLLAQREGSRASRASDAWRRHSPHGSEDVRVREHGPGPPQVHLREDGNHQPPNPDGSGGRSVGRTSRVGDGHRLSRRGSGREWPRLR